MKISFTFFLTLSESIIYILFLLFIGFAINDILKSDYTELIYIGLLGLATLVVDGSRRLFDTRIYVSVYEEISTELAEKERKKDI